MVDQEWTTRPATRLTEWPAEPVSDGSRRTSELAVRRKTDRTTWHSDVGARERLRNNLLSTMTTAREDGVPAFRNA